MNRTYPKLEKKITQFRILNRWSRIVDGKIDKLNKDITRNEMTTTWEEAAASEGSRAYHCGCGWCRKNKGGRKKVDGEKRSFSRNLEAGALLAIIMIAMASKLVNGINIKLHLKLLNHMIFKLNNFSILNIKVLIFPIFLMFSSSFFIPFPNALPFPSSWLLIEWEGQSSLNNS